MPATSQSGRPPAPPGGAHTDPRPEPLSCEECRAEIPRDEAVVSEAQDYVMYFCSPACHAAWRAAHDEPLAKTHDHRRRPR